eukprot:gnl/TRDRNA2_/TRDRNA2_178918_c0_seq1.p1 gnl/TRDRNA2_/TRDRNA2_178918_c0~~gnl/TRDRNA2_/TRDRNA2_178918_c0_seq1.p1  ORF type:complete len:156 (+),score=20.85 gnl/TRDRNA2_/TRDRNA2_178918_c0_seq1:80-547(+)
MMPCSFSFIALLKSIVDVQNATWSVHVVLAWSLSLQSAMFRSAQICRIGALPVLQAVPLYIQAKVAAISKWYKARQWLLMIIQGALVSVCFFIVCYITVDATDVKDGGGEGLGIDSGGSDPCIPGFAMSRFWTFIFVFCAGMLLNCQAIFSCPML